MKWLRRIFRNRQLYDTYLLCWQVIDTQVLSSVVRTGRTIIYARSNSVESLDGQIAEAELAAMGRLTAKQAGSCLFQIVALLRVGEEFKEDE